MEIVTQNAKQTFAFGQRLANSLKRGGVVACYGELGSGKTTFTQGLASGLGIKQRIISPTFVFIRSYHLPPNSGYFYHIDLYRIENLADTRGLGLEEILANPRDLVVIEWAEKIKEILPPKRIDLYFENLGKNERKITRRH